MVRPIPSPRATCPFFLIVSVASCGVDDRSPSPTPAPPARPGRVVGRVGADSESTLDATSRGAPGNSVETSLNGLSEGSPPAPANPPSAVVEVSVQGDGRVRSEPSGLDCPGICSASFAPGTALRLVASGRPGLGSYFSGWEGECTGLDDCETTLDASFDVTARFGPANFAFVTSLAYPPTQRGGRDGADTLCRLHAGRAGLDGDFVAWLSSESFDAIDGLGDARGWVRLDGVAVADEIEALPSRGLFNPLRIDELGGDVGSVFVATGTSVTGRATRDTCGENWNDSTATHTVGRTSAVDDRFSEEDVFDCSTFSGTPLYCFGTDYRARVEPADDSE